MQTFDLGAPCALPADDVVSQVERTAAAAGLEIRRSTLKAYPGCVHWHFRRRGLKGTLEATWYPAERRLWLAYHDNRYAPWLDEAVEMFRRECMR